MSLTREHMRSLIRTYFDGCNEADVEKMKACFVPEAVHYFPANSPASAPGPFIGADTIARRWAAAVRDGGSCWTIDSFCGDESTGTAVIEWTHFKQFAGMILRGDEWYRFDPDSGLIREIRAYYAAAQPEGLAVVGLGGFDYPGRDYAMTPPVVHEQ